MNQNAIAVIFGILIMILGILNDIDERVRIIVSIIVFLLGVAIFITGLFIDKPFGKYW